MRDVSKGDKEMRNLFGRVDPGQKADFGGSKSKKGSTQGTPKQGSLEISKDRLDVRAEANYRQKTKTKP